ncbi:MAG: hypothetical protein CM15mP62_04770 [Rhodospirillaceae bacterium]|nr:MAG: hypothetical protein CM15mP62_04770 [Rhodospirillaceae bacterium]
MSMSERGMPRRFLPGNATKFLHKRSMELLGLCLLTLAFSFLLINLTYNSADPSFNTTARLRQKFTWFGWSCHCRYITTRPGISEYSYYYRFGRLGYTACFSAGNWPRHTEDILFIYSYSNDSYFIRCFANPGYLAIKYRVGGCNWLDIVSTISESGGSSKL